MKSSAGFTLIELMTVIVILAIMLFLALPNFNVWLQNTQIRTAGEAVLNGMQLARAEAIRRNTNVRFQLVDSLTSSCALSDTGRNWVVSQADPSGACQVAASDTVAPQIVQKKSSAEGSPNAVVTASPAAADPSFNGTVTFNGFGSIATNVDGTPAISAIKINAPSIGADSRDLCVLVGTGGTIRMCDPKVVAPDTRTCGAVIPAGCL